MGNNLPTLIGTPQANQTTSGVTRIVWIINSVLVGMMTNVIARIWPYVNTTPHGIPARFLAVFLISQTLDTSWKELDIVVVRQLIPMT